MELATNFAAWNCHGAGNRESVFSRNSSGDSLAAHVLGGACAFARGACDMGHRACNFSSVDICHLLFPARTVLARIAACALDRFRTHGIQDAGLVLER